MGRSMRGPLVIGVMLSVMLVVACETIDTETATIVNRTEQSIMVSLEEDGGDTFPVEPGEEERFAIIAERPLRPVLVFDDSGEVIFQRSYTWEEIVAADFRIVIE